VYKLGFCRSTNSFQVMPSLEMLGRFEVKVRPGDQE
jgi:hypothetical protein